MSTQISSTCRLKPATILRGDQNPLGMLITRFVPAQASMPIIVRGKILASDGFHVVPTEARILGQGDLAISTADLDWISEGYLAIRTAQPSITVGCAETTFAMWAYETFSRHRSEVLSHLIAN